jgi:hypothetical protein
MKKQLEFHVVHPLDDVRERKIDMTGLGPMRMTRSGESRSSRCAAI